MRSWSCIHSPFLAVQLAAEPPVAAITLPTDFSGPSCPAGWPTSFVRRETPSTLVQRSSQTEARTTAHRDLTCLATRAVERSVRRMADAGAGCPAGGLGPRNLAYRWAPRGSTSSGKLVPRKPRPHPPWLLPRMAPRLDVPSKMILGAFAPVTRGTDANRVTT